MFGQIQDVEEIIPEKDHGGCSSSLACLDSLQEKQSQCLPSVHSKDYMEEHVIVHQKCFVSILYYIFPTMVLIPVSWFLFIQGWQFDDDVLKKKPVPLLSDQPVNNLMYD